MQEDNPKIGHKCPTFSTFFFLNLCMKTVCPFCLLFVGFKSNDELGENNKLILWKRWREQACGADIWVFAKQPVNAGPSSSQALCKYPPPPRVLSASILVTLQVSAIYISWRCPQCLHWQVLVLVCVNLTKNISCFMCCSSDIEFQWSVSQSSQSQSSRWVQLVCIQVATSQSSSSYFLSLLSWTLSWWIDQIDQTDQIKSDRLYCQFEQNWLNWKCNNSMQCKTSLQR